VVTQPAGAARPRRRARPAAVAHRCRSLPALWPTKLDTVFTYSIGATRGTRLAHLGLTAGDDGS
jgi:hypothetical protein